MNLNRLLAEKADVIVERWLDLILETYPPESVRFMKREKDPFQNPVGQTFACRTRSLYEKLLEGAAPEEISEDLEEIVKIRSVQEFAPSRAVAFVFLLKRAVREQLADALKNGALTGSWAAFESRIDDLALATFDLYMGTKERMFEIRVRELRRNAGKMVEMLKRVHRHQGEDGRGACEP